MKIKILLLLVVSFALHSSLFAFNPIGDPLEGLPPCSLTLSMSSTPYYCTTSYEGSATVTPAGGITPYTYSWSGGQTTSTILGLAAGTYSVLVEDSAGCSATGSVVVAIAAVSATATPPSIIAGDSTLLSAIYGAPASYSWAPAAYVTNPYYPSTNAHPPVTTIFTITVNNYCGTVQTTDTVIVSGCTFHDSIIKTPYYCSSSPGSITVSPYGGTSPYTYSWSPGGQTTAAISGLSAGSFDLTITDASGCNLTNAISVSSKSVSYAVSANPYTIIIGDSSLLTASCNTPATFSWAPASSVRLPSSASTYAHPTITTEYTVTITTACGTYIDSVKINVNCFNFSLSSTPTSCSSGSATITPSGGVSPYTYSWSPGGGTTAAISGISAGTYSVTAYDALGCSVSGAVSVSSSGVSYTISGNPLYILPGDSSLLSASCTDSATFSWSPPLTVRNPFSASTYALPAVTTDYKVTITTACQTFIDSVLISVNCFNLATASTPAYCSSNDGSAVVTPLGGTPPYTYFWSPGGQTTDSVSGLNAGSYFAVVRDFSGCSSTSPVTIAAATGPPPITSSVTPDSIMVGDSAYLTAFCGASSTYIWSPTTGLTNPTSQNTYAHPTVTTVYTVSALTVCGSAIAYDTVFVYNCRNTFNEPICIVTIDTGTNKCEVIWGRTNSPPSGGSGYYKVYKDSVSGYTLTHSQPLNVLSEYIDPLSNPAARPVSYELSTFDSCGESSLSLPHTSIYLTTSSGPGVYILNWTPYVGFTPSEYRIYRGLSMSTLIQIDSLPTTVLSYRDTLPPLGSIYLVEAVNPAGVCTPTTHRPVKPATPFQSGSFSNGSNTTILGVQPITNEPFNLSIYPNPGNGVVSLQWVETQNFASVHRSLVRISVMDELGQIVFREVQQVNNGTNKEILNLSALASGIYSLNMETNSSTTNRKLVIIKNK